MSLELWSPLDEGRIPPVRINCGHVLHEPGRSITVGRGHCPTCGGIPARELVSAEVSIIRDKVPTQELTWDTLHLKQSQAFRINLHDTAVMSRLEDLLAHTSAHAMPIHLQHRSLRPAQPLQSTGGRSWRSLLVYRSTPLGSVVACGTICIPVNGVLLLGGSGACFQHVTFSGGALVCAGTDFTGSFYDCTFRKCQLYVVHGAAITLRGCTHTAALPGLVASGAGTIATATECAFHDCSPALCAEHGAVLAVHDARISNTDIALAASGAGTHAELSQCEVEWRKKKGRASDPHGGCAVRVVGGAACVLRRCGFHWFQDIGTVSGSMSRLEVLDCYSKACQHGVSIRAHARAVLRCMHMDSRRGQRKRSAKVGGAVKLGFPEEGMSKGGAPGEGAAEGGALAVLERCVLPEAAAVAVEIANGKAALLLCAVISGWTGLCARGERSVAVMQHCAVDTEEYGAVANAGAAIRAEHCHMSSTDSACIATNGSRFALVDSVVSGKGQAGQPAVMATPGCVLRVLRCDVSERMYVMQTNDCTVRVVDSTIRVLQPRHAEGEGLSVGYGSNVEIVGCVFLGQPASYTWHRSQTEWPEQPTVSVCRSGRVLISGCMFKQFRVICIGGEHECVVRECEFTGTVPHAPELICLYDRSRALIEQSRFSNASSAIKMDSSVCRVLGCEFGPELRHAFHLHDDCDLTAQRSQFVGCDRALYAQPKDERGTTAVLEDCDCTDMGGGILLTGAEVMFTARRLSMSLLAEATGLNVRTGSKGGPIAALLEDCTLAGGQTLALVGNTGAHATLLRCTLRGGEKAVEVMEGASVSMRDSRVEECDVGAGVGPTRSDALERCPDCGMHGPEAWARAWAAARGQGPELRREPRCVHDGAIAELVLAGVEFSGCADTAVRVEEFGRVDATGVHVSSSLYGFWLGGIAPTSVFVDCVVWEVEDSGVVCCAVSAEGVYRVQEEVPPGILVVQQGFTGDD